MVKVAWTCHLHISSILAVHSTCLRTSHHLEVFLVFSQEAFTYFPRLPQLPDILILSQQHGCFTMSGLPFHHAAASAASKLPDVNEESPLLDDGTRPEHVAFKPPCKNAATRDEPSTKYLILVLGSVYIGVFLGALDTTIVATLSVPISSTFNSLSRLSWLGSSYLIANAVCQPISGRLTDIFSRRSGLIVSNFLFGIGLLICGLAKSETSILAGRVVAGMGGGGFNVISAIVASDLVPLRKRGIVQGVSHVCYGVGAGLGGLFGGWVNGTIIVYPALAS